MVKDKKRIPRSIEDQLSSLDDHLFILRSHLKNADIDDDGSIVRSSAHVKVLASTLRTLVADNPGLLFSLARELGVDDTMGIHLVGKFNPDLPLVRDMTFGYFALKRKGECDPKRPVQKQRLAKVLQSSDAFWVDGSSFTYHAVIREVAQQVGTSHEDREITLKLAKIRSVLLNGEPSYVQVIEGVADLVLELGEQVLREAERKGNYQRRKHSGNFGDATFLLTASGKLGHIFGRHYAGSFRSAISRASVNLYVTNTSLVFGFERDGTDVAMGATPFPEPWRTGDVIGFSAHLNSSAGCIEVCRNGELVERVGPKSFGWVFGEDFKLVGGEKLGQYFGNPSILCWDRHIKPKDLTRPLRFSPLGATTGDCLLKPVFPTQEEDE